MYEWKLFSITYRDYYYNFSGFPSFQLIVPPDPRGINNVFNKRLKKKKKKKKAGQKISTMSYANGVEWSVAGARRRPEEIKRVFSGF